MEHIVVALFWLVPILLGYIFGRRAEAKHFQSIHAREKALLALPATSTRVPLAAERQVGRCELVHGSVAVSIDYFKRALAALRSVIGGPVQSYETLLDRARREAVLRLKESCPGADEIINLRIETSSITGKMPGTVACVEVLACGTAIYFSKDR